MKSNLTVILGVGILLSGCNFQNQLKDFDYGKVENNKYTNSFFNIVVTLPEGWKVQSKEQMDNLAKKGEDLITGDNKDLKRAIKASEINTANLLGVFQYEVGAAVDYNPNFMMVAENLIHAPGVKSGSDYLFHVRKYLKQSQVQIDSLDNESTKVLINGQEFYYMNVVMNYLGYKIKQSYYATIINDFALSAIISYVSDEQKLELEKIVNSMKFKK